jgi:aminopeptidase N
MARERGGAAPGAGRPRARVAALAGALVAALLATTGCVGGDGPDAPLPADRNGSDPTLRPDPSGFAPGATGLGDPYFPTAGNQGYDVDHYALSVTYDPASKQLTGRATIAATATADLSAFSLDLSGLTVRSVRVDDAGAAAERGDEKLVVTPDTGLAAGTGFTVVVSYDGVPEPVSSPALGGNGFHPTDDGAFVIGQPRSASTWYPVNDHPLDKATYDIEVTVPEGLAAVSNGVPMGRSTSDGWTTWRWAERSPMASYLTTLAIGDYRVHEGEHRGRPLVTAVHTDLPTSVDAQLRRTGEVADVLAEWFGPYPFESYGGIVLADHRIRFALETQSRPIYGPSFFQGGRDGTWVIVHELAHQWFGDSVSVRYWNDMWLNEGFATYAEWLWEEETGGDTAQETFDLYWEGPGAEAGFWSPPTGDPGPERLFSSAVYERGAMTLHALRRTVGDDAFFEILRTWAREHRDGNATTDDLVALAERISGRSLDALFDAWLYTTARPEYPAGG